ncbi:uncharacterized protein LOC130980453 [Arachis stenosperma]|uniref:uncharacterized protein LOC130980453 n=1 Tax=Arachis stenosperma TaxID=217475 RepID=UPI0025AC1BC3|nr:uncharacterized protein LOC130980453 [Arachis stenosperma]
MDIAGRMVQWAIELSEFDLKYESRTAIKAQCLTDFLAEYAGDQEKKSTTWELYVDRSSNKVGSSVGIILVSEGGTQIEVSLKFEFLASNNQAEYEALIAGLKLAVEVGATKVMWIEAEPLATITAQRSQKFLYKNIITRYGVPHSITTDNGTQFTDSILKNLVASMKIKHQFTSVEHPQANGQAEAANKVILAGLKKRLQDVKGACAEELPQVLWAYRTTPQSATGETSFRLAYGIEAMIPVEINE